MMSLVSTPLSVARVAAPKKAIRKTVTAKASAADAAKSAAVAGALALTIAAQPALAVRGVETATVTLHVGGGTFLPIRGLIPGIEFRIS